MSKNNTLQRYIYKIHSSRIIREKYNINMTLQEARNNEEVIGISESQIIRYIDYLNGFEDVTEKIAEIKLQLKHLKKSKNIVKTKPQIKKLYKELDKLIFKKDFINVVIDETSDYEKLCKHKFIINGITYHRLLGTPNGVKHNTIVFVNDALWQKLVDFIDNGRDLTKAFIPAKLEAYKALVCSSSTPVSMPKGIIVVKDCITEFKDTFIKLDDTNSNDPIETLMKDEMVTLDNSDGYGMAMPQLMKRWGEELGEDYILPGCVIRNSFLKGAVCCIDFQKFCNENKKNQIKDVWGEWHNINDVELVITESMLKLWDSYSSISNYLDNCVKNHYTFSITKNAENELENQRVSNYQFIQSYDFTDNDIDELIAPTVEEIKDITSNDYRKMILYTKGVGLTEDNVKSFFDGDIFSALIINEKVKDDPYLQSVVNSMINKRIERAKIGVLNIQGNYSLVFGDPYALCQSMCELPITGLLKRHQVYCKYWIDKNINKIVTFRAPMTSHNNIRVLDVVTNDKMDEFYKYITTPTLFNAWDMCTSALNGMDCDGDCVINTSNEVLIRCTKELPAIECIQRKAEKIVPTDEDMMKSNIKSFGNAVGSVTNKITAMFDIQAGFDKNSEEYKILDHRIRCGQLFQQNAIDKTKGIQAKPMPIEWYSWQATILKDNEKDIDEIRKTKEFNRKIVADKKPYFMQYIYPTDKANYLKYIKDNKATCIWKFGITLEELENKKELNESEKKFLEIYYKKMPLSINNCVINRICRKIENLFKNNNKINKNDFDYTIYKSDVQYDQELYKEILLIYKEYVKQLKSFSENATINRIDTDEKHISEYLMNQNFRRKCYQVCPNSEMLCNIVLDICYSSSNLSKKFAWDMCGKTILNNLLKNVDYNIYFPVLDKDGDIEFHGEKFSMKEINIKEDETIDDSIE